MTDSATQANVRLTDGLGPLPEYAHEFRPRWPGDEGGFTSEQMRAYAAEQVAAERERCLDVRLSDDDALRFACRVLESDAPAADKEAARDGLMAIRTRIRA